MGNENDVGLLRRILDAMPAMIFVVDDDVRVQEYNKAAADFLSIRIIEMPIFPMAYARTVTKKN